MQEKNKKTLLITIILIPIVLAIISCFSPITCINYLDVIEDLGLKNFDGYTKGEHSLILWHHTYYDLSNPEKPSESHTYKIFNLFVFKTDETVEIDTSLVSQERRDIYQKSGDFYISTNIANIIYFSLTPLCIALFFYFCYKGIKNIDIKKTKYFLYISILLFVLGAFYIFSSYYHIYIEDTQNIGYINYITFGYGFYLWLISIISFFMLYILQPYYHKILVKPIHKDTDAHSHT